MRIRHFATWALLALLWSAAAAADDNVCATLVGAANPGAAQGFALRDGEPVDFIRGGRTVHGKLLVFSDGDVYRAYWQPDNSPEKYVLANAGADAVRLVSSAPRGTPAPAGQPGTALRPQRVLSCPML
ncbi:hypothetical protein BJG93_24640 [Paraburkholderia sprentiae WSM5005]|uniref:Uncharacterized protein n=1 Tax=Paraburkholderia sprentiae WSM5005 TaxID=754502 RepID=A0A1I9YQR4_9BURK|nr:hypothetical protein [Paraburkholderia sprentiae]APA88536.1 hypothetical protein BJG93_24640 [Paraburkholderia sprentiae WSM5005]